MSKEKENQDIEVKTIVDRAYEIDCLYRINEITSNSELNIEDVIEDIIKTLPLGFRFRDICHVEVILYDNIYTTSGLVRTELKISNPIRFSYEIVGEVNVYYIKPIKLDKGIFTLGEHKLLKHAASKISDFLMLKKYASHLVSSSYTDSEEVQNKIQRLDTDFPNLIKWMKQYHLSGAEIASLLSTCLHFRKGETIGKQGAFTSYFLLLAEGCTKSVIEDANGRSYSFMVSLPFDFISLSSLFGGNYYFTTSALTPSKVFLIEKSRFLGIMNDNARFNKEIIRWLCDNYAILFNKLSTISLKQTMGRMAMTLLYLKKDVFKSNIIPSFISRKDLAELSAMSNENAVRILSEFKSDEIIRDTPQGLEIINEGILTTISMTG